MAASKPNYAQLLKTAETVGMIAIGVGATILVAANPKLRKRLGETARDSVRESLQDLKFETPVKPDLPSSAPTANSGVVYLLKAGPFFKIGKAQDFEKRLRQIKLQLPYSIETVHQIRCDDITHVEGYWHRKFAAERRVVCIDR